MSNRDLTIIKAAIAATQSKGTMPRDITTALYHCTAPFPLLTLLDGYRDGEFPELTSSQIVQVVVFYRDMVLSLGTRRPDVMHGAGTLEERLLH